MTNNKAREINSPVIKQLLDETTPEELAKIDAEMTNNKQQTAVDWFAQQVLDNWNDIHAGARDIIEFLNKAEEMEVAGKEMSYAEGYKEGYKRALKMVEWYIKNHISGMVQDHIGEDNKMVGGKK
jgi:flagellar biosynthesis/type III secretory pathway protein FliH